MTSCPICKKPMKKELKEYEPGVFIKVDVCTKCGDEWVDKKGYKTIYNLFNRKTFNAGGSIAVRIPKEIVDALKIKEGQNVSFSIEKKKVIINLI